MDNTLDPKLKYFLKSKPRKKNTIVKYRRDVTHFSNCIGKTPSDLIREARYEEKNIEWMDERKIPTYFDKFIKYIEEKQFTEYSQKMMIGSVKAFYHCFEITTPDKTVMGVPKSYHLMYEDLPQYDEIRKLISLSNPLFTALFGHMASSGMNYSDATSINVDELIKAVNFYFRIIKKPKIKANNVDDLYQLVSEHEGIIPAWRMWRFKTSNQHITFSSPESLKNILDYFQEQPPLDLSAPIFRAYKKQTTISYKTVSRYLTKKNQQLGWTNKKVGEFAYITSKSFRTFFLNELEDEDLNYRDIRLMMGHKFPGVDRNYSKNKAAKFLRTYEKGVHRLTFAEKPVLIGDTSEEVKELQEELKRREVLDKEKDEEIKQLRADVDRALQLQKMNQNLDE